MSNVVCHTGALEPLIEQKVFSLTVNVVDRLSGGATVSLGLESPLLIVHVRVGEKCTYTVSNRKHKMHPFVFILEA